LKQEKSEHVCTTQDEFMEYLKLEIDNLKFELAKSKTQILTYDKAASIKSETNEHNAKSIGKPPIKKLISNTNEK
jgi:hypothetical protein